MRNMFEGHCISVYV